MYRVHKAIILFLIGLTTLFVGLAQAQSQYTVQLWPVSSAGSSSGGAFAMSDTTGRVGLSAVGPSTGGSYTVGDGLAAPPPTPTPVPAQITIIHDTQPDSVSNFRYTGGLGAFILDDPTVDDGDVYSRSQTVAKPAGRYTVNAAANTAYVVSAITCLPAAGAVVDLPNRRVTLTVSAGAAVSCTYTVQRRSTVTGVKFNDLNGNGARASTEPFLNGWTMNLYSAPGVIVATRVTTDVVSGGVTTAGRATFASLAPGNYVLCERLTASWRNTRPNSTNPTYGNQPCIALIVEPGRAYTVLFGNRQSVAASEALSSPLPLDSVFTSILPDTDEEGEESTPLPPFELPVEEAEDGAQKMYLPVVMN
jgi:hypothetical protein